MARDDYRGQWFCWRTLVKRLLETNALQGRSISALILLDKELVGFAEDKRLRRHCGSVTDAALLRRALADGIDVVFHLVSIPGGAAEQHYSLGYQVNLLASLELLDQLREQPGQPVLVYASSSGGVRRRPAGPHRRACGAEPAVELLCAQGDGGNGDQ